MRNPWAEFRRLSPFRQGIVRLRSNWVHVIQAGVAAMLSFFVGHRLGHPQPFFAPISAIIVLSTTGGERFRRSVELVIGVCVGVGLGDLLIATLGTGTWQIGVGVMVAIALSTVIDKGVLLANQAAFAAILVATILPPGTNGGTDRMFDALLGGLVGLTVMAVVPESPLRSGRREVAKLLGITGDVLHRVAQALHRGNMEEIVAALVDARGTQGSINAMISATNEGREAASVSPLLWGQRHRIRSMARILNPVDNAIRNTRVMARHALVMTENHDAVSEDQIEMLERLSAVAVRLSALYAGTCSVGEGREVPQLIRELQSIGAGATLELAEGRPLSAQAILAQSRALVVDLLQICGLSRRSAVESLAPTSEHPAPAEDLWNGE